MGHYNMQYVSDSGFSLSVSATDTQIINTMRIRRVSDGEVITINSDNYNKLDNFFNGITTTLEKPPSLDVLFTVVNSTEQRVQAAQLTYSWSYTDKNGNDVGVESDSLGPLQLQDYGAITLSLYDIKGGFMMLFGDDYPPLSVAVRRWDVEYVGSYDAWDKGEPVEGNGNWFTIADDGHDYIYEVYATWVNGSSRYVFRIDSKSLLTDVADIIERNLDSIAENTLALSSIHPSEQVRWHAEYDEIVALGNDALQYMFSIFERGGQTEFRGYIMAIACHDILGIDTSRENLTFSTGQDWYDTYKWSTNVIPAPSIRVTIDDRHIHYTEDTADEELIYEDTHYKYSLTSTRSDRIMLTFEDDGQQLLLNDALSQNKISIEDLILNGLQVIIEPQDNPMGGSFNYYPLGGWSLSGYRLFPSNRFMYMTIEPDGGLVAYFAFDELIELIEMCGYKEQANRIQRAYSVWSYRYVIEGIEYVKDSHLEIMGLEASIGWEVSSVRAPVSFGFTS